MQTDWLTFELAVKGFEIAAVAVMVVGALASLVAYIAALVRRQDRSAAYTGVRRHLERTILLGLDVLIIADIIRSVVLQIDFAAIGTLGLLILVRTFLSWSLEVELDGRWPWQRTGPTRSATGSDEPGR